MISRIRRLLQEMAAGTSLDGDSRLEGALKSDIEELDRRVLRAERLLGTRLAAVSPDVEEARRGVRE